MQATNYRPLAMQILHHLADQHLVKTSLTHQHFQQQMFLVHQNRDDDKHSQLIATFHFSQKPLDQNSHGNLSEFRPLVAIVFCP